MTIPRSKPGSPTPSERASAWRVSRRLLCRGRPVPEEWAALALAWAVPTRCRAHRPQSGLTAAQGRWYAGRIIAANDRAEFARAWRWAGVALARTGTTEEVRTPAAGQEAH